MRSLLRQGWSFTQLRRKQQLAVRYMRHLISKTKEALDSARHGSLLAPAGL